MKPSLVQHLVCPYEDSPLQVEVTEMDGREIKEGLLRTPSGRTYPIRGGVPRFVNSDDYVASFSRQRQYVRSHFETYLREFNYESAAELFVHSTGFDLSDLDGLTLDAGC